MPIQCHESSSNWDGSSVNASALHLLAQQCLNITDSKLFLYLFGIIQALKQGRMWSRAKNEHSSCS